MTLQAVDCLTPLNATIAHDLRVHGVEVVFRYQRNLTKAEVEHTHNAGLGIGLIYETNPTHRSYFTKERGISDAQEAIKQAESLGVPESAVILHTVDYDVAEGDIAAIEAYVDGVHSVLGDRAGLYGDFRIISHEKNRGVVKWLWQTYGWSYGSKVDGIQAYQHQNAVRLAGIEVDLDELYTRDGIWWPDVPKPISHQGGEDVKTPLLEQGVKGHDSAVKALQGAVGAKTDGIFGPRTKEEVMRFQRDHHLQEDGIVGPNTWAAILK